MMQRSALLAPMPALSSACARLGLQSNSHYIEIDGTSHRSPLRPPGPKIGQTSQKILPMPSGPQPQTSKHSLKRVQKQSFSTLVTFFGLSCPFGKPGASGPGRLFQDFLPKGSCDSSRQSQFPLCAKPFRANLFVVNCNSWGGGQGQDMGRGDQRGPAEERGFRGIPRRGAPGFRRVRSGGEVERLRSRPGKPNQRKGQNEKFMNFAHFCEFWCFSLGKQARFTLNFCSGMPLRKVHELTFLWFGLSGPLLRGGGFRRGFGPGGGGRRDVLQRGWLQRDCAQARTPVAGREGQSCRCERSTPCWHEPFRCTTSGSGYLATWSWRHGPWVCTARAHSRKESLS